MAELWFVGLGLGDSEDVSPRIRRLIAGAGAVFVEAYTSELAAGSVDALAGETGRPIVPLGREAVEGGAPLKAALERHASVVLLVAGDPFVATTHVALREEVEAWGHRWRYLPNATVLSAVPSFLGLMHYRFGRTVSVPFEAPGFAPRSPLEGIGRNRDAGLHTLVLLDLVPAEGRYLRADEALRQLARQDDRAPHLLPPETPVAVVARVGRPEARAWFGTRAELERTEFGPPLHALVVPAAELHEQEAAALERWRLRPGSGSPD
jgi:diphthine synthase